MPAVARYRGSGCGRRRILYLQGLLCRWCFSDVDAGVSRIGEDERMTAKVTVEEVARVAELSHLKLTHEETGAMLHDLNAILEYVAELNELDTEGVAPLSQVTELMDAAGGGLRGDVVAPSLNRAQVLGEAPETNGVFFKVPKVIER
jgi:aspartyl-tRNA(Asn)/glutamyl-tRNA(Gln) amidotransferase subunit C